MVTSTYNLSYERYEMVYRIYLTVGQSPFTSAIASEIVGIPLSSRFFAWKNAKVVKVDHYGDRVVNGKTLGKPVTWYRFTETWITRLIS